MELECWKALRKSFRAKPVNLVDVRFVPRHRKPLLTTLVLFALSGIALLALWRAAGDIQFEALVAALDSLRFTTLLSAVAATLLSYAVLAGYDFLAFQYGGIRLPAATILVTSICGYGIGNAVGLGTLSGGAVRYRLYSAAGLSPKQIALIVGFISFAFGAGALTITSLFVELRAPEIGRILGVAPVILQMVAGGCLALILVPLVFWLICRNPIRLGTLEVRAPSANVVLAQFALVAADLIAASAVLWVLLPTRPVDFVTFAALYASALILGVLTHIPGGLGLFEVVIFYALGASTSASTLAAALLAYRAIYFVLPLLISILLLVGFEVGRSLTVTRTDKRGASQSAANEFTAECPDIPS
jgi:phosphatidylglycerol lysyltransferase